MRSLVYLVAASLDGRIADESGDTSSFPVEPETLTALFDRWPETCPAHLRDALGITGPPARFDTVVMGARTFAPALEAGLPGGAYPHLRQVVVTHDRSVATDGVEVLDHDVPAAVAALKAEPGRDLWLCGGADLAGQLIDLVDEVVVKINPLLLGSGVPLVGAAAFPRRLELTEAVPLPGGVLLATYRVPRAEGRP